MTKSVEWYTPKWVFDELGTIFDLDPSSPHDYETFVPAKTKYTIFDNGLTKPWFGRVWLNPPYSGGEMIQWINRLIDHNDGITLVFCRTDARWCQAAMKNCSSMLFVAGRINFVAGTENKSKNSGCGAASVFFSFGAECADILERLRHRGIYIKNQHQVSKQADLFH